MRLSKSESTTYDQCLGKCHTCLLEGGCTLEDKLKARKNGAEQRPDFAYPLVFNKGTNRGDLNG